MNTKDKAASAREEIEQMLPWHAAGALNRREARLIEEALEQDASLAHQYELVREELAETIHLNETLGAPSSRAMEKLMAGIAAEARPVRTRSTASLWHRVSERLSSLSPATLAWSATAAAAIIAIQAGLLTSFTVGERSGAQFETASSGAPTSTAAGQFALVGFVPQASAADITRWLEENKLVIVEGPRAGGLFRVRVAEAGVPADEVARRLERLRGESAVVRLIAPTR
jgi:hypothetical protein